MPYIMLGLGLIITFFLMVIAIINFKLPTNDPERDWYGKQLEKEYKKMLKK